MLQLTDREAKMIEACLIYTNHYQEAGMVGHGQMILIAKLAQTVSDQAKEIKTLTEALAEHVEALADKPDQESTQ